MYYTEEEYPYNADDVPDLRPVLETIDWDIMCIFDACRWDAFVDLCDDAEPVKSFAGHTNHWLDEYICNPDYDFSEVTYLSANPMTLFYEQNEEYTGSVDEAVKEHITTHRPGQFRPHPSPNPPPEIITEASKDLPTPLIIHYVQPHNPFIGDVSLGVTQTFEELPTHLLGEDSEPLTDPVRGSRESHLVKEGHVSLEVYRLAYLTNLQEVWRATSRFLESSSENVVITADHGELLGPSFGHSGFSYQNQGRIVPLYTNWDVDLPEPQTLGASESHDWVYY